MRIALSNTASGRAPRRDAGIMSRRLGLIAIIALAVAFGTMIQATGWAQTSSYSLIRALAGGSAKIDQHSWETRDASYFKGHYYSVKAPGMAFLVLPLYASLDAVGGKRFANSMAHNAHEAGAYRWYHAGVPSGQYHNDITLAKEIRAKIENYTPFVWMLGLLGAVIPALAMMLLVRSLGDTIAPGFGTASAIALGAGTLVMPFATLFFPHLLSATLAFAAFALLWREREGPPRPGLLAAAGLLAGLAVTTEYALALAGVVLGVYAITRIGARDVAAVVRRGATYSAGALAGVAPLFAYNLLAFGSFTHFSYENAIKLQGVSGHDVLGLNDGGFFGITTPTLNNAFDLLFSSKGLFILSPVLLMSLVGLVLMWRAGRRAEALVIGGVFGVFLVYNAGYWLPFGGGSPGPRFLIAVLPFLAVALAPAFKRFTATSLALTIPSVLTMAAATSTVPMIGNGDVGLWVHLARINNFEQTIASAFGADNTWSGLLPFLIALGVSLVVGLLATRPLRISRDAALAAGAVIAWGLLASIVPHEPENITPGPQHDFTPLILVAVVSALALLAAATIAERLPRLRRAPSTAAETA